DVARHLEVFVHRLPGDEQVHDLARPLEDQIDAEVAHDALDRHGPLSPGTQGVGRLVAAAAADLDRVVDDAPAGLGVVQLGDRGFEADVVTAAVGHGAAQLRHGLHGEGVGRHGADLLGDRVVFTDGAAPLHALARPATRDLEAALPGRHRRDGERQAPRVQRDQGELQAFAFAPQHVLPRHAHVLERYDAVVDG